MHTISRNLCRLKSITFAILTSLFLMACKMTTDVQPRNQSLPLFKPHIAGFICEVEATKVPPIDAQADVLFHEARALDNPEIYYGDRDYKKMVQLTRQAADRHHWKAMLNLASLYLQGFDPPHGTEDAVQLVEQAMRLGIPAAYDRMGTYYMNGTGVNRDATRAYAFWQKAAEMGNPDAMTYLADQMDAGEDSDGPGHWSNIPVATKMLECAFAQGYGPAAYNLHFIYIYTRESDGKWLDSSTRETKARTLKILHEGIKLGCEKCARDLSSEFDRPFDLSDTYVPHVDKARGERYLVLTEALGFDPSTRFPNLDKVVPLPPAALPPWNGDRDTLLHAAMGVIPHKKIKDIPSASNHDRHFVHPDYALQRTGHTTGALSAPWAGYWRPTAPIQSLSIPDALTACLPGLYGKGERFSHFYDASGKNGSIMSGVVWEHLLTVQKKPDAIAPLARAGATMIVPNAEPLCRRANSTCPLTGTWQPWVRNDHPMRAVVNQYWRQTWLTAGQSFPHPQRDWLLALPESDITWHLMDASKVNINL